MFKLLHLSTKLHAFFAESGMLIAALLCVAGGIAILSLNVPFIGWAKKGIAFTLFAVAIFVGGHLEGYRARATLDASAELRDQIAARDAELQERARQAQAANEIADAARQRAERAEAERNDRDGRISDYVDQLSKQKDVCSITGDDARRLREFKRHDPGFTPPKPPLPKRDLRAPGAVPVMPGGK